VHGKTDAFLLIGVEFRAETAWHRNRCVGQLAQPFPDEEIIDPMKDGLPQDHSFSLASDVIS
jgi:hypothetical protein